MSTDFPVDEVENSSGNSPTHELLVAQNNCSLSLKQLSELVRKTPNEVLSFILNEKYPFLSLFTETDTKQELISYGIIALGKACSSELRKDLNKLLLTVSSNIRSILINMQQYLVLLRAQENVENFHLDSLFYLTIFLRNFQLILPSSSLDFISIIIPLVTLTCKKHFKDQELNAVVSENLKEIDDELNLFMKHYSVFEIKDSSEAEKLHLLEPPESFRSLSVTPTVDDILMPCSFLRPNVIKGKYRNAEHYLDVQFRLLREDYIKPLRDGIIEYLCLKKNKKSFKNCKSVHVYTNVQIVKEEFLKGNLIYTVKFCDKNFSSINWENSKRFLTGNLLCLSSNDFHNILFASVSHRDVKDLKKSLLRIQFVENSDGLNLSSSISFVMIETSAYFGSYCHNLKALQTLNADMLPMKRYIIDVEKTVNCPQYLQPTTIFDMRPLLVPLGKYIKNYKYTTKYENPSNINNIFESIKVRDDDSWPRASELNLDQSQLNALKSAITKEFSIIQGPPGTGKTFVGLRVVQLLLHNRKKWFRSELNVIPILIVCYTNHALDQFLEGVLLFTENIVRIGGRGTNDIIAKYQINNLVKSRGGKSYELKCNSDIISEIYHEINKITENIEKSTKCLITQSDIEASIPPAHLKSLKRGDFKLNGELRRKTATIAYWLGAVNNNETSSKEEHSLEVENSLNKKFCENIENPVSKTNEEVEIECEADVEFIENQRNIDFYDLEEAAVLRNLEYSKPAKNSKLNLEYIRNMLEQNTAMKEHHAMKIKNIWSLHINVRWQLYKYWLKIFIEEQRQEYLRLQAELKRAFKRQCELQAENDFNVLRHSYVVGLTTTGAAKYRHIVNLLKPAVLIVEEAAEILESHIITSLAPETQHVILIGDQQQLRPSPSVHMLAVKYGMNVSLFERMIKNGVEYCKLSLQHRMRPEIASLIVPHIYPDLKNHEVVTKFSNIKGVGKNVFFISHSFTELPAEYSKSKVNAHEAKFLIELCKYLLHQGYKPSQITVLTTYSGQLFALKRLATGKVEEIRFTVVDNFQGEENDIILISFVRSNDEGQVGFLKVSNRICVALSRAKKGLYCIGNFELLAQKSNLWKSIVETLNKNMSIGPALPLVCQNHPSVCSEVANDTDFSAVPEGGCSVKCDYRLSCGHSCTLFCHPYDKDHNLIRCAKPCNTVCKEGHPCLMKCFEQCIPCPFIINKTLECGHTVPAACGLNEGDIKCPEPCIKVCDKGHKCPKKCFQDCKPCPIIIDKTLKCGHTVPAACGLNEGDIKCPEPCIKVCDKGHKCPKKCFQDCKPCPIIIDKTLKCGHTLPAACGLNEGDIKCPEPCIKICDKGHKCSKKCFQDCKPCPIIIDKTLRCGHTVPAACGLNEILIKCPEPCNKTCSKGHKCRKKCSEVCGKCKTLVDKILVKCNHTVKVECGMETVLFSSIRCQNQCTKICKEGHQCAKKCYEMCGPCKTVVNKTLPLCGHIVKMPCGKDASKVICNKKCSKILSCGHECPNKCIKACVVKCTQESLIESPVCGHILKVRCKFTESFNELQRMCSKPCGKVLPCGHICKGDCGDCYQGRLHMECQEICERILICGHKCSSKCSKSCPPCVKPCENRCSHSRCPRKCGSPCVKCFKKCTWFCSHKKCTRRCFEICDREPCNKPCMKILSCNHYCVGFCGEPCPVECQLCNLKVSSEDCSRMEKNEYGLIYLEDCKHVIKEYDLNKWFYSGRQGSQKIEMKTCPECRTIIRRNVRFNKLIKTCIGNIEKIKLIAMHDKEENLKIQRSLLKHPMLLYTNTNKMCKPLIKDIISYDVGNIQELLNFGNLINIVGEIELKRYCIFSMFALSPFLKSLVHYARYCRTWLSEFICNNFFTISEYQLVQLSDEVYRLNLIDLLLNFAHKKYFFSHSPDFENCVNCILNFKPLTDENIKEFENLFQNLIKNFVYDSIDWAIPSQSIHLTIVNMSGYWYECSNGGITCFLNEDILSNKRWHSRYNMLYREISSSNSNIQEIVQDKTETLNEKELKKKCTTLKAKNTHDQNTEDLRYKLDIQSKSLEYLPSMLLKKLNNMHKMSENKLVRNLANETMKVSKTESQCISILPQKITEEVTQLQLCKKNDQSKLYQKSSKERYSNSKSMSAFRNQEKATGAIPKHTKLYSGSQDRKKGQNEPMFNCNFKSTSKYLTKDEVYHNSKREEPRKMFSERMAASQATTTKNHGRNHDQKSFSRSQSQGSFYREDSVPKSSTHVTKTEGNTQYQTYFPGLCKYGPTSEITCKKDSKSQARPRQTVKSCTSQKSSTEYGKHAANSAILNKPLGECLLNASHKNESLSKDLEKDQNVSNRGRSRSNRSSRGTFR